MLVHIILYPEGFIRCNNNILMNTRAFCRNLEIILNYYNWKLYLLILLHFTKYYVVFNRGLRPMPYSHVNNSQYILYWTRTIVIRPSLLYNTVLSLLSIGFVDYPILYYIFIIILHTLTFSIDIFQCKHRWIQWTKQLLYILCPKWCRV